MAKHYTFPVTEHEMHTVLHILRLGLAEVAASPYAETSVGAEQIFATGQRVRNRLKQFHGEVSKAHRRARRAGRTPTSATP